MAMNRSTYKMVGLTYLTHDKLCPLLLYTAFYRQRHQCDYEYQAFSIFSECTSPLKRKISLGTNLKAKATDMCFSLV